MVPHTTSADKTNSHILLVDDDAGCRRAVARVLSSSGLGILHAASLVEAREVLLRDRVDAVVSEVRFPDGEGVVVFETAREANPFVGRVILTGAVDFRAVQDAVNRASVHAFFTKPWDNESLLRGILGVLDRCRLERENAQMAARLADRNLALEALVRERTAALERAKADLQAIFDAFEEPMALVTQDLRVLRANRAWALSASLDVREVVGRTCHLALFRRPSPCEGCPVTLAWATGRTIETEIHRGSWRVHAHPLPLSVSGPEKTLFCRYSRVGS